MELVRYLFTIPGLRYFLSERICQDPLEKFFGCQRQRGRVNENPSVSEFVKTHKHFACVAISSLKSKATVEAHGQRRRL